MKLFLVLAVLVAGYCYILLHTTDMVLSQTMAMKYQYQHAEQYANQLTATR